MARPEDIDAILRKTLDDRKLTRGEKRALSALLEDADMSPNDYGVLRAQAFEIAREELTDPKAKAILEWLEDVSKVLLPEQPGTAAGARPSEAWFSPDQDCVNRIIQALRGVRRQCDICVYTITDNRLSEAVIDAHKRGAKVRVITDNEKLHDLGSDILTLDSAGVPVRIDNSPYHMHHKFAIFDGRSLLTGSYNWTRSAASNNEENFLISEDAGLVKAFQAAFDGMWEKFGG